MLAKTGLIHLAACANRNYPSYSLLSRLRRRRRAEPSSPSFGPEPRSLLLYQVDENRVDHLSCSQNRNDPSYSSYSQDCVDRDWWNRPPRRRNRCRALVVPTKSTRTGSTTFPVLQTGTILLILPVFQIVSTEEVGTVLLVVRNRCRVLVVPTKSTTTGSTTFPILRTGTILLTLPILQIVSTETGGTVLLVVRNRCRVLVVPTKSTRTGSTTFPVLRTGTILLILPVFQIVPTEEVGTVLLVVRNGAALTTTLPSRQRQGRPPFLFSRQEQYFLFFLSSRLCRPRRLEPSSSSSEPMSRSRSAYQVDANRVAHLSYSHNRNSPSYSSYSQDCVD
jgi:hypothetical protein